MTRRVVVDAGAVLSWFEADGSGAAMRRDYEAGELTALAPRRLHEDLLAAIAARAGARDRLGRIAIELPRLGIVLEDPPLPAVADWIARGLDAGVAPYAALAERLDVRLVSSDPRLLRGASGLVSR